MAKPPKPIASAAEIPLKAQTNFVRWMLQVIAQDPKAAEFGPIPDMNGRIVTFHGRAGETQLKAIIASKDVALYRWRRKLDLELRTALAQEGASQKCGVMTSDASVIAALDAADLGEAENEDGEPASVFGVSLGQLSEAEEKRRRD